MGLTVTKDWKNPHFKSSYITLDNLVSVLVPACNALWLLIYHVTVNSEIQTIIKDISNEKWESVCSYFPIWDVSNPQKIGSVITYAKRYNLCQIFNITSDVDDDANQASNTSKLKWNSEAYNVFKAIHKKYKTYEEAIRVIESKYILAKNHKGAILELYKY